ncbi:transposase [Candidatus Aerophobetes bacterium]|nr:transposase [Candidatus Aerophobetes bacterium]
MLCLDDLDPERSTHKHLITSDRIKGYILYIGALLSQSEEEVAKYLITLKELGIEEVTCFIVDKWKSFPPVIHKVYPDAKIQYDYFNIWEAVNRHLDKAMKGYSRYLNYTGSPELAKRVWSYRRIFLKHPKRYTEKDKKVMDEIILSCKEDLLTNILILKDRTRDIFENSSSQDEAYKKKNKLYFKAGTRKIATLKRSLSYL